MTIYMEEEETDSKASEAGHFNIIESIAVMLSYNFIRARKANLSSLAV